MSRYHVYGVGNALVDMEYEVTDDVLSKFSIDKGLMTLVDEDRHHELADKLAPYHHKRSCGGSAANTVIALAQLGGKAFYSCRVANDEPGQFYLQDLRDCGVASGVLEHELEPGTTGKCLVMVTPDADRTMNSFLGITSDFSISDLSPEAIADSDYVYIEGYLVASETGQKAAVEAARLARAAGVPTSLTLSDPNMVNFFRDGLLEMAGDDLDLLFCNEAEAGFLAESDDINVAVETLKQLSKKFAITRGPDGALIFDGEKLIDIKAPTVTAVDTNGAGDMFAGSFLHGITQGMSYAQAGELASMTSSHLVTELGPRMATEQTQKILKAFQA